MSKLFLYVNTLTPHQYVVPGLCAALTPTLARVSFRTCRSQGSRRGAGSARPSRSRGFLPVILSADVRRNGGPGWQRRISSRVPRWVLAADKLSFWHSFTWTSCGLNAGVGYEGTRRWYDRWRRIKEKLVSRSRQVTGAGLTVNQLTQPVSSRLSNATCSLGHSGIFSFSLTVVAFARFELRVRRRAPVADILSKCCGSRYVTGESVETHGAHYVSSGEMFAPSLHSSDWVVNTLNFLKLFFFSVRSHLNCVTTTSKSDHMCCRWTIHPVSHTFSMYSVFKHELMQRSEAMTTYWQRCRQKHWSNTI